MNQNSTHNYCLNCRTAFQDDNQYCSTCGQSKKASDLRVLDIIGQFFETFFTFDGAIWKTIRDLWRPSYLTKAFVAGQRRTYVHPVRLFVITLLLFVALMINAVYKQIGTLDQDQVYKEYHELIIKENLDSLLLKFPLQPQQNIDSIKYKLFDADPYQFIYALDDIGLIDNVSIHYKISDKDVAELSIAEIYDKYKITSFYDRLIIGQSIKVNNDRKGMLRSTLGNFIWMVLLTIFVTAGFLMIIYIRHKPYYTELIVLMLHHHVIFFILSILLLLCNYFFELDTSYFRWVIILAALFIYLDIKFYFRQSWIKSLVKFFVIALFYFITFFFNILLVALSSFLLI